MVPDSCSGRVDSPFIVLFEQDRADEADDGVFVGEDADDLCPSLDVAVGSTIGWSSAA
jgi:hypothetical protein